MAEASAELLQAAYRLKRAVEAGLQGNTYYLAAHEINELIASFEDGAPQSDAASGTAQSLGHALSEARKATESGLSGNRYYMVANRLDALASLLSGGSSRKSPNGSPSKSSFNALAAASKARVEEVAAGFGIALAGRPAAPSHAEAPETLNDGELERRSSEPCGMAELAPPIMEPVAAAALSAQTAALPPAPESPPGMGSSLAEGAPGARQRTGLAVPAKTHAGPEVEATAAADDRKAPSAGKAVEAQAEPAGRSPKQKTLFKLWLDLLFGRKD